MEDTSLYTLGNEKTAKQMYAELAAKGQTGVVNLGRLMSELTIPSLIPPEGYEGGDNLPGNNQSAGAQCLNNLASLLTLQAFPPGQPIARLKALEYTMQEEIDADPQLYARVLQSLAQLELTHRELLQVTTLQTAYGQYIRYLLVAGNALWKHIEQDSPMAFAPNCYVVKRNVAGVPLITIHEEKVSLMALDEDLQEQVRPLLNSDDAKDKNKNEWDVTATVQSVMKLRVNGKERTWLYWQECEGEVLNGTTVETDILYPPMWPGWLVPVYGADWGGSYCEQYRGDLYTLEAHASALNDGSSLAALSLLFVKPGSQTSIRQVREARNLETLPGDADDLSVFRTDKSADFGFVENRFESTARRLNRAFLLQSSVQRSGERVTAEEIRRLGTELDKALGGLYTQIAQGNQRVIIRRAMRLNEEAFPDLPSLPDKHVQVQVITGIDALGNTIEYDNLMEYAMAGQKAFPKSFEAAHNSGDFFLRIAAAKGVKPDGLIKTPEQLQADEENNQQQMMQEKLLDKGTAPAVQGMAAAMQAQQQ